MLADQSGSNFEPIPEGQHLAWCFGVIGLGKQKSDFDGKIKLQPKARLMFVLPQVFEVFDESRGPEPRIISKNYTLSLDDRATLTRDLKTWRVKNIPEAEKKTYDLCERLGKPATLTVVHKAGTRDGKLFAVIEAVNPVPEFVVKNNGLPTNPLVNVTYDITMGKNPVFEKLPKHVQEAILKSEEFTGEAPAPATHAAQAARTTPSPAPAPAPIAAAPAEDDVPF